MFWVIVIESCYVFVVKLYTPFIIRLIGDGVVYKGVNGMKNRRSRLEIHLDVLKLIKEGTVVPTRIMYGANLSWKLLNGILSNMVAQSLIEEVDVSGGLDKRTSTIYRVTPKGVRVVRYFDRAKEFVEADEHSFNPLQIAR